VKLLAVIGWFSVEIEATTELGGLGLARDLVNAGCVVDEARLQQGWSDVGESPHCPPIALQQASSSDDSVNPGTKQRKAGAAVHTKSRATAKVERALLIHPMLTNERYWLNVLFELVWRLL